MTRQKLWFRLTHTKSGTVNKIVFAFFLCDMCVPLSKHNNYTTQYNVSMGDVTNYLDVTNHY